MIGEIWTKSELTEMASTKGFSIASRTNSHTQDSHQHKKKLKTIKFEKETKALIYATLYFCFAWSWIALYMLQNVTFYWEARSISRTQPWENKEAAVTGPPRSMGCTTVRSWFVLGLDFCSFFALWSLHNKDDNRGGESTIIERQLLGKKTKNPIKHIKQPYPSTNLNRRVNNNNKHNILLKTTQNSPKMIYILSTYHILTHLRSQGRNHWRFYIFGSQVCR